MVEEVRTQVFEPFFTTGEVGKGTGMGLAVVYGIVHAHDGWIAVSREPGKGAQFEIFLPVLALPEKVSEEPKGDGAEDEGRGLRERIL